MPPSKKRKIESDFPDIPPAFLAEVNGEVDNEIALKQQLTETLEARIAWALLLQDSIKNGDGNGNGNGSAGASEYAFRNDALDALSLGEQNSEFILQGDPIPPPAVDLNRTIRAASRKQQQQSSSSSSIPINVKPKPSFLYTRSNPLATNEALSANSENCSTYILRCPECSRTAFTSLQGVLNHARLAHNLEWGTHENCIRSCAVLDNNLDVEAGIEVGLGPVGIPALRELFQRAVGSPDVGKEQSRSRQPSDGPRTLEEQTSGEKHLVKTLGFHGESPALAPYLGKESTRREIKVWDEDLDVDVFANESSQHPNKKRWKMPFTPRNFVENSLAGSSPEVSKLEQTTRAYQNQDNGLTDSQPQVAENIASDQSRFHLSARIVITDRSLWIPPEKRSKEAQKYTHKWMISVDAPAYTRHITSVLNSVKVGPSDTTLDTPSTEIASKPPFVVIGFANRPFLAKIELSFSGTSSFQKESSLPEQKVTFEHWVDLDLLEHRDPYDGQDQVLDVELDKNTVLKPPQLNYTPIKSKNLWDQVTLSSILDAQNSAPAMEEDEEEDTKREEIEDSESKTEEQKHGHENQATSELSSEVLSVLRRCVKQFPMTLFNARAYQPQPSSTYRPVASPQYFKSLVLGRRKAIEWSRARAIQNAYTEEMQNLHGQHFTPLSVARVFLWMSQNGHFIREGKTVVKTVIKQEVSEPPEENSQAESDTSTFQWCPICGLEADLHKVTRLVKMEHVKDEEEAKGSVTGSYRGDATLMSDQECHIVPRVLQIVKLPRINLSGLISHTDSPGIPRMRDYMAFEGGSLVATADPRLILSIDTLLSKSYPSMSHQDNSAIYPVDAFGEHRADVENTLSTPALLAHLTKQFLHVLVKGGLEVAKRDKIVASGTFSSTSQRSNRRAARKRLEASQLLTPTHILSGILTRGRGRGSSRSGMDTVVLSSLSNMGMTVEYNDHLTPSRQGESQSLVKLEE